MSGLMARVLSLSVLFFIAVCLPLNSVAEERAAFFDWSELAELPSAEDGTPHPGVAGPFVGVHNGALLIAGGANFPNAPLWESDKLWHDRIIVLLRDGDDYRWLDGGRLERKLAYGAAVSTPEGVLCMGGGDGERVYDDVFLLKWDPAREKVLTVDMPDLPAPRAYGSAALIGSKVYLAAGMSSESLADAGDSFWMLDLAAAVPEWRELEAVPGGPRAFNIAAAQHNGFSDCVYVFSGRREDPSGKVEFLTDIYEYSPARAAVGEPAWRRRSDSPHCVMAGTAMAVGQSHLYIMGGADGSLFGQDLRDAHPGFFKRGLLYHAITDTWSDAGPIPSNQVTTIPVRWDGDIVLASGEIRPRVRSPQIWRITPRGRGGSFGAVNYTVLVLYLLGMVGIGVYFANKNASTDDYFRGGKKMVWWAAGCSIFATMLSSLTYTGIPSKAFAQDWVYLIGNFMIFLIAPLAIYIALPFFRYIDATSAYEYMEKRFNRGVRLFSSASFTLFHIFRMAVVMSLTALALAVATPLSPAACVLIMGLLSIIYCTLGGIEAVIWTDTVQTVILLGGGILAFVLLVMNVDGGFTGFLEIGANDGKFHMVNLDFSSDSYMRMAIWVVILGSFGQNISSYTADQAVVQRYMTTPTQKVAARSIWTNAILSVPASLLFFAIGAGLYAFYKSHPEKLDPGISTDQIFPLFIADDMPIGIAGLIVAGIFAAAQSTVSTSMNSTATTLVTDFMRPLRVCRSEAGYLRWARILTFLLGAIGTAIALLFINPSIRSLFDSFIKIIGLFMGVLGGLFLLGIFTRRGNGLGALLGALAGAGVMLYLGVYTKVNGYIYAFCGVSSCFVIGYLASLILPCRRKDLDGLTFYSIRQGD